MTIDLSYAAAPRAPRTSLADIHSLSVSVQGWTVGWATFVGANAEKVGHFTVKDHMLDKDGQTMVKVPVYRRVIGAMDHLTRTAAAHRTFLVVSHTSSEKGPLWSLAPILALMLGASYGDMPNWKEHLGKDVKELRGWAALLLGKPPGHETEVLALGLGAAAAKGRESEQLDPSSLMPVGRVSVE